MADSFTTNYNWTKPEPGASDDTWGSKINVDLDGVDSTVKGIDTAVSGKLNLTGGTLTGPLSLPQGSASPVSLNFGAAGGGIYGNVSNNQINFAIGGTQRVSISATGLNSAAIGATTPSTGAFTNLSASGTVSGVGFNNLLSPYALTASVPTASSTTPVMDGTAAAGVETTWARGDHKHPSDTSKYDTTNPAGYITSAAVTGVFLPLSGGTLTGTLNGVDANFSGNVRLSAGTLVTPGASLVAPAGTGKYITANTGVIGANTSRWSMALADASAESGGNAGSNFSLTPYNDAGTAQIPVISVVRATGVVTIPALSAPQAIGDNRIINGDMRIDQRNNGASGTAINVYTVDRWKFSANVANKGTWVRGGPFLATSIPAMNGFNYALRFTSSSAYASATGDICQFFQIIEADMVADLAWGTSSAQPVTLSFWAFSTVAGIYGGAIGEAAGTRSYPFSFSLPVASSWTKIVITIPGDTSGTYTLNGNSGGIALKFDLGCGATYRGAAGAWSSNNYTGVTGAVSIIAANGTDFFFTGVKLEIGSVATPFNRQSVAQSVVDCQRYFQLVQASARFIAAAANNTMEVSLNYTSMRVNPTATLFTAGSRANLSAGGGGYPQVLQPVSVGARFAISAAAAGDCYALAEWWAFNAEL